MKVYIDPGYLEYDIRGKGVPILFIHGYPLSRKIWDLQMDGLSDIAMVISVDLRGHGESYPFEGPYSMDLLAEDCKHVLVDLNIKQPVLVCGLSMGGYVTLNLYRMYPQLFKGMILTSTRSGPDSPEGKVNRDASIKNALEHGASFIADNMIQKILSPVTTVSRPELVKSVHAIMADTSIQGIVGALQGMRDRPDSTPVLPKIDCPVLIIHGLDDQLIPIKEAESMKEQIPEANLVVLSEAGHLPNLEQPDKYNLAIRNFVLSIT